MRSISLSMTVLVGAALAAALAVGCKPNKITEGTASVSSSTSADTPAPVIANVAAGSTPPSDGTTALYDIDTDPQKAPAGGTGLERIIKGLHMRVCIRADVAPFASFTSTGLDGFEVELATKVVEQISIDYKQPLKIDWVVVSAGERIKRLQDDACDLLVGSLSYTPERAKEVSLSKPYLKTDKVLLQAAKVTRKTPVIAKVGGTTGSSDIKGTERAFNTYQEMVYAMDAEEIDYLITDRPIADQLVRSSSKPFTVSKTLAAGTESYVAAVRNGQPELLGAVDKALDDMARSGRLALAHRRWL